MTLVILVRRRLPTIVAISHYVVNQVLICANLGLGNASLRLLARDCWALVTFKAQDGFGAGRRSETRVASGG